MEGVINILVAILLGALIGLQREFSQQKLKVKTFAGIRTFILIAFLGSILGYLSKDFNSTWNLMGFIFTMLLSISAYIIVYKKSKNVAGTTEVSFILTYLLGVMATTGYLELSILLGILTATFLTFKENLHRIASKMKGKELVAMVEFALIAFVVLPFLPNKNYSPADIPGLTEILNSLNIPNTFLSQLDVFNFHKIWLMVIFIAGINLFGYFLVKFFGSKKGYGLTGFVGGLISSTAVTISMSEESKKIKNINPLLIATILASAVMFLRVIFEVAVINYTLLPILIIPLGGMALTALIIFIAIYRHKDKKEKKTKEVELKQPFALLPALKFGAFFAFILFLSRLMQIFFGKTGIYITSLISGLADVDAITLTMSSLSNAGTITQLTATTAIVLAVASNTIVKVGLAYFFGKKKFANAILISFTLILLVGLGLLFLG